MYISQDNIFFYYVIKEFTLIIYNFYTNTKKLYISIVQNTE